MIKLIFSCLCIVALSACSSTTVLERYPNGQFKIIASPQPDDSTIKNLHKARLKTIINFRHSDRHEELAEDLGLNYVQISIDNVTPDEKQLQRFFEVLDDESNYPILMHCQSGSHRTGVMTAIYRIEYQKWSSERALHEMKDFLYFATHKDVNKGIDFIKNYRRRDNKP